jgi:hypothetical protein
MAKAFTNVTLCNIIETSIPTTTGVRLEIEIDIVPNDSVLDLEAVTSFGVYYNKQINSFEVNILQVNTLGGIVYIKEDPETFALALKALNP